MPDIHVAKMTCEAMGAHSCGTVTGLQQNRSQPAGAPIEKSPGIPGLSLSNRIGVVVGVDYQYFAITGPPGLNLKLNPTLATLMVCLISLGAITSEPANAFDLVPKP
jgi:hypothetical protein